MSWYEELEIPASASLDEINHAFRIKSLKVHPDRSGGSHEAFLRLTEAYNKAYESCQTKDVKSESVFQEQIKQLAEILKSYGLTTSMDDLVAQTYFSRQKGLTRTLPIMDPQLASILEKNLITRCKQGFTIKEDYDKWIIDSTKYITENLSRAKVFLDVISKLEKNEQN